MTTDIFNKSFPSERILQREYRGWPPIERLYLEKKLLPLLCKYGPILFIGTSWYTSYYKDIVGNETAFITVDKQERKKPDILADITTPRFLKLAREKKIMFKSIIFNGVIGYGINNSDELDCAIENMKSLLGTGGRILFGWNLYACKIKTLLGYIEKHNLLIEKIEGKNVYSGNKDWSKIVRLRYLMAIVK